MKILLINPSNPFNGYHVPRFLRRMPYIGRFLNFGATSLFPPLNLALLGAYAPSDADVEILDGCVGPVDCSRQADLVGITALTSNANAAYAVADRFRQRGVPVAMGGNHPTVLPQEALQHCDAVVTGEADETWPQLVEDFRRGRLKNAYQPTRLPPMEGHPVARRELLDPKNYLVPYTIETARGCPFDCDFCSVTAISGQRFRHRPIDEVVAELRTFPSRKVFFVDDNIVSSVRRSRELLEAITPLRLHWGGQTSITIAKDEGLLGLAAESGCKFLFIGLESFLTQDYSKLGGCNAAPDQLMRAIAKIRDHGIAIWGAFIVGLETDDRETIRRTVELAIEAGIAFAQFSFLTPLPGTRLRDELVAQNRVFDHDWSQYGYGSVVFQHGRLSSYELSQARYEAWKRFYELASIRARIGLRLDKRTLLLWAINLGIRSALSYGLKRPTAGDQELRAQVGPRPQS